MDWHGHRGPTGHERPATRRSENLQAVRRRPVRPERKRSCSSRQDRNGRKGKATQDSSRSLQPGHSSHEPALARSPAFRRQDVRPAKAGTPCQQPPFMAPMRDARIVEALHEPQPQAERWGQKNQLIFLPPSFCPSMNRKSLFVNRSAALRCGSMEIASRRAGSESGAPTRFKAPMRVRVRRWRLSMNRLLQGVLPSGGRTSGRLKPELRASSRREEAHSFSGKGSQSLLTSAATVQGFRREDLLGRILWMKSVSHSIGLPWRPLRPLREAPQPDSG